MTTEDTLFIAPRLAADGANTLLVWRQQSAEPFNPLRLFAARIAPDGALLDTPIRIGGEPTEPTGADVVFDGFNQVVAWPDRRGGSYAARVTPAGVVLDPDGFPLSAGRPRTIRLATDRTRTLALATDDRNGRFYDQLDLYGARLDTAGRPLDPAGFLVGRHPNAQFVPSLASRATGGFAAWSDHRGGTGYWDLVGTRLDAAGNALDDPALVIAASDAEEQNPVVTEVGGNWLVVWQRSPDDVVTDILAARVSPGGVVLDPGGVVVVSDTASWRYQPAVASAGSVALAVWADERGTYAARIDGNGTVLDPGGFGVGGNGRVDAARVAWDGTDFVVLWAETGASDADLVAARVTTGGLVRDVPPRVLRSGPESEFPAELIATPSGLVLLYHEMLSREIRVGRVGPGLAWLDGPGVKVGAMGRSYPDLRFAAGLAFDGATLAAATLGDSLELTRLAPDLTPLDAAALPLFTSSDGGLLAYTGIYDFPRSALAGATGEVWLGLSAFLRAEDLVPRAYLLRLDLSPGCLALPRIAPFPAVACENSVLRLDGSDSPLVDCSGSPTWQWQLDGAGIPGAASSALTLSGLPAGPHAIQLAVGCSTDVACRALSAASTLDVIPGPAPIDGSFRLARRAGGLVHAEWTDLAGVRSYAVLEGGVKQGPIDLDIASATSGSPGADFAEPASPLAFLRVAARDRFCGTGP